MSTQNPPNKTDVQGMRRQMLFWAARPDGVNHANQNFNHPPHMTFREALERIKTSMNECFDAVEQSAVPVK